jgi:GNAT superfamily N-acetyltransferase
VTSVAFRRARPDELATVAAIDDDAGTLDTEWGLVIDLDPSHPFVVAERARWQAATGAGLLEVAEAPDGTLAGFAARGIVDGEPYLDQLSVRRLWMRRGIGTSLLRRAADGVRVRRGRRHAVGKPAEPLSSSTCAVCRALCRARK